MKKIRGLIVFLVIAVVMLTACSNGELSDGNINISGEKPSETDVNEVDTDSKGDTEAVEGFYKEVFFGKVKSIIGNEIEIEIGTLPDQTWEEEIDPEEKEKSGVPEIKVVERENPEGMENIIAPNPPEYGGSIFGENGEINLNYTGESRTLIIPAGTDIRNILDKKETLDSIKKGTVLMITPKVIDGKDAGIETLRILG